MTLDATLYALVKDLIGAETLIFADPNAPRPVLPYWTLNVQTNKSLGSATLGQGVTNDGDLEIKGVREATVRIQRLGADSSSLVTDLRDNAFRVTVLEKWQLQNVSLYNVGDVQNVPFKLDNSQLEPRAVVDLFIRYGTSLLDRVGVIETVEIAASYEGKPDLTETITVVL
jgi:hypothetical protein